MKLFSLCDALLVVSETRPTSKMSFTFVARETNFSERERRFRHTVATRLVKDVCYITPKTFMRRIKYVRFRH